ncbi:MAG: hypothetical protein WC322_05645 [Candidatus Paceibacterota bacterium]|jgi:hypothetical protein
MKYSVSDGDGDTLTLEKDFLDDEVTVVVTESGRTATLLFTKDEFKQLRRAVGYVWTELEGKAE